MAPDSLKIIIDSVELVSQDSSKGLLSTEFLSVAVALLAVIVGPMIQLFIAKKQLNTQNDITQLQIKAQLDVNDKQIKADIVSKNRQEWIHLVRGNIAEFISYIYLYKIINIAKKNNDEKILNLIENIFRLEALITMQLNSNDHEHQEFVKQLNKVSELITSKDMDSTVGAELNKLTLLGQKIFNDVWNTIETS